MKLVLSTAAVLLVGFGALTYFNSPAPAAEQFPPLEETRNITAPPEDFRAYTIKSVPENTDPSLGQLIDANVYVVEGYNKEREISVRALKPRDGLRCSEIGMGDYLAFIDGKPTTICVITELR